MIHSTVWAVDLLLAHRTVYTYIALWNHNDKTTLFNILQYIMYVWGLFLQYWWRWISRFSVFRKMKFLFTLLPGVAGRCCSQLATIVEPPHIAKPPLKSSSRSMFTIFMRLDIFYIAMKLVMTLSPVLVSTSLGNNTCNIILTNVAKHIDLKGNVHCLPN